MTTEGSKGPQIIREIESALKKVGVDSWFSRVAGGCVDGAELKKLRYDFINKVTGKNYDESNSDSMPIAVVLCWDAAHGCDLCIKDALHARGGIPFMIAQEARLSSLVRIFGEGKRQQFLKEECVRDKVKYYVLLKTSATRWVSSRAHSYHNMFRTFPQQTELLLQDRMPKRSSKEKLRLALLADQIGKRTNLVLYYYL